MLSLLLGIGYIRKLHSLSTVSAGVQKGEFEGRPGESVKELKMKQPLLNESGFLFLPSTFEEMCLTAKHNRNVFKSLSRKYLQHQSSVSLIFYHTYINCTMRVHCLNNSS